MNPAFINAPAQFAVNQSMEESQLGIFFVKDEF